MLIGDLVERDTMTTNVKLESYEGIEYLIELCTSVGEDGND